MGGRIALPLATFLLPYRDGSSTAPLLLLLCSAFPLSSCVCVCVCVSFRLETLVHRDLQALRIEQVHCYFTGGKQREADNDGEAASLTCAPPEVADEIVREDIGKAVESTRVHDYGVLGGPVGPVEWGEGVAVVGGQLRLWLRWAKPGRQDEHGYHADQAHQKEKHSE